MGRKIRNSKSAQFLKGLFLPVYDKSVYYIKYHRLLSASWAVFVVLAVIMSVALKEGWGVDKSKLGYYFEPEIVDCSNGDVETLVGYYYTAYVSGDTDTIKTLSVDPDNVETVKPKSQVIEYFDNFSLHWVKGQDENTYVLYVYWEVKFNGIETGAPGIETFYIVKEDGSYLIKNKLNAEEKEFMAALKESKDSKVLYAITDTNLNKALEDQELKDFYEYLLNSSKK